MSRHDRSGSIEGEEAMSRYDAEFVCVALALVAVTSLLQAPHIRSGHDATVDPELSRSRQQIWPT